MSSLFDSDDGSSSSEKSHESVFSAGESHDDDATTFTVATVLEKRHRSDKSRRDTITRTLPNISIDDKYAIPTTVEKKELDSKDERMQLRVTDSLMDDSSDSENDGDGDNFRRKRRPRISDITTKNSFGEDVFSTPTQDCHNSDDFCNKSTTVRRNTAALTESKQSNLLDIEVSSQDGVNAQPKRAKSTNRRHSSDTFMSVYEDLGTKQRTPAPPPKAQTRQQESSHASSRGAHVKTLVATALKSVANELVTRTQGCDGVGSWDVEKIHNTSGKKHPRDFDDSTEYSRQSNRRKPFTIRTELTLMQDMVHEKTEECNNLKRKLEESQRQIQDLQNEHSLITNSKVIVESKLGIYKEDASAANARVESISSQLKYSQSEIEKLRVDLEFEREKSSRSGRATKHVEAELKQMKQEKEASLRSQAELQNQLNRMRNALKEIKELDITRSNETHRLEAELHDARDALSKAKLAAAGAESIVGSLRSDMEALRNENESLRANLKQSQATAGTLSWEEGEEGIEIQVNKATPQKSTSLDMLSSFLDQINESGAEDGTRGSEYGSKLPLKTVLQNTPDPASRQLKFNHTKTFYSAGKENHHHTYKQQSECALCFHPPRPNGVIKSCQCGKSYCYKWAHASCLLNRKSISSSVSHPGTPPPPPPPILCDGIWCKEV